jgi:hypothetical protein
MLIRDWRIGFYRTQRWLTGVQWEQDDSADGQRLVDSIEMNTKHYVEIMSRAVDAVMPEPDSDITLVHPPALKLTNADRGNLDQ